MVILVILTVLTVTGSAQGSIGFESVDHRVHCEFRRVPPLDPGGPIRWDVRCSSDVMRRVGGEDKQEYLPCLVGGENSPQLEGPGVVSMEAETKPEVDIGCYLGTHHFKVVPPGGRITYGGIVCSAPTADEIRCAEGSHGFSLTPSRLRRWYPKEGL